MELRNIIRKSFRRYINEVVANNSSFQIPPQLESFYQVDGDFSNVKNWKGKILLGNSMGSDKKVGDWDSIGYVLISLNSNYIIPVTRSDEHQVGYELLDYLVHKYKIKNLNYKSVYLLGNHFVYGGEYHNSEMEALKKAYEYGARNIIIREMWGKRYLDIDDFLKNDGDFKKAKESGKQLNKLSQNGQRFINELKNVVKLFEKYNLDSRLHNPKFESTLINASKILYKTINEDDILWGILMYNKEKTYKAFEDAIDVAIESGDIKSLEKSLFGFNGVKNVIHTLLRNGDDRMEELFWSTENALKQFNELSNIKI